MSRGARRGRGGDARLNRSGGWRRPPATTALAAVDPRALPSCLHLSPLHALAPCLGCCTRPCECHAVESRMASAAGAAQRRRRPALKAGPADRPSRAAIVQHSGIMQGAGRPFLSRHALGEAPNCCTALPFAAAGAADDEGVALTHNLLALGTWSQEAQVMAGPCKLCGLLHAPPAPSQRIAVLPDRSSRRWAPPLTPSSPPALRRAQRLPATPPPTPAGAPSDDCGPGRRHPRQRGGPPARHEAPRLLPAQRPRGGARGAGASCGRRRFTAQLHISSS